MKKTKASVGAVPAQVEAIRKKTFEKLFAKMRCVKMMEIDVQKRENDFFWEHVQKPISTQEERDDRDILKKVAHLGFADEWRAVFRERDEIAELEKLRIKHLLNFWVAVQKLTEIQQKINTLRNTKKIKKINIRKKTQKKDKKNGTKREES